MTEKTYTTEEVAQILKVSKLTIYDLVKKGVLPSYRVGRQLRISPADLEEYIARSKNETLISMQNEHSIIDKKRETVQNKIPSDGDKRQIIISGQDISLDILAKYFEINSSSFRPLRSYAGSLESLISMYQGSADIVSTHLYDGKTDEYNLPYIRSVLVNFEYVVINLLARQIGFYVAKGNPKNIRTWSDLAKDNIVFINREKGSGARVLVDESLRENKLARKQIKGYENEETNHLSVATAVAKGQADIGVGIEKTASIVQGVDFIPLVTERYDLVVLKTQENINLIEELQQILSSKDFQQDLHVLGGYDLSKTGQIIYEA